LLKSYTANKKSRPKTTFLAILLAKALNLDKCTLNTYAAEQIKTILATVLLAVNHALDTRLNNEL
jgi:hypothetical protein